MSNTIDPRGINKLPKVPAQCIQVLEKELDSRISGHDAFLLKNRILASLKEIPTDPFTELVEVWKPPLCCSFRHFDRLSAAQAQ